MKNSAYSLLELLVGMAVLGALVSVGGVSANRAIVDAKGVKCLNNLRQIGIASFTYASDNQGQLPQSSHQ
ncbi:MAG: type II secretion system protein, partial [Chthoniobacterales bacterium]